MKKKYSFLSEFEPTDAQLEMIMKEVALEAQKKKVKADKFLKELIHKEVQLTTARNSKEQAI